MITIILSVVLLYPMFSRFDDIIRRKMLGKQYLELKRIRRILFLIFIGLLSNRQNINHERESQKWTITRAHRLPPPSSTPWSWSTGLRPLSHYYLCIPSTREKAVNAITQSKIYEWHVYTWWETDEEKINQNQGKAVLVQASRQFRWFSRTIRRGDNSPTSSGM